MATYTIEESTLTGIADAIRSKNGSEDLYTSAEMAEAIEAIEAASPDCNGLHIPEEALVITGNCRNKFSNNGWNWFLNECADRIVADGITDAEGMFTSSTELTAIPFDIRFDNSNYVSFYNMFSGCTYLEYIGKLSNMYPSSLNGLFSSCLRLRYLPDIENLDMSRIYNYANSNICNIFYGCYSLRSIPESLLEKIYSPIGTGYYYAVMYNGFNSCYALDEIKGLNPQSGVFTANAFNGSFMNCCRAKDILFKTQDDGTPYICNWSKQTVDMTTVGFSINGTHQIIFYNSGLTTDTQVKDDASYQALKDNPDWWTIHTEYSRYNHDSAVNTINTLPNVSSGSGNIIKFRGICGSKTDGGAINTLTEEEIAVAAAKGWTVTMS